MYGCEFRKPTLLVGSSNICFDPQQCSHDVVWFREVVDGKWIHRAHPPLRGKIKAIPADQWTSSLQASVDMKDLDFLSRTTSAYPSSLSKAIARSLIIASLNTRVSRMKEVGAGFGELSARALPIDHREKATVEFINPLKGVINRDSHKVAENMACVGGLRQPAKFAKNNIRACEVGLTIESEMYRYFIN
jgi:hypothetical protein